MPPLPKSKIEPKELNQNDISPSLDDRIEPKSKIEPQELNQDDISLSLDDRIEKILRKEKSHKDQQLLEPRRSGRMIRQPDRYLGIRESDDFVSDN